MKKAQIVELVKRGLDGGDSPAELRGRFHEKEIALYIGAALNSLLGTNNSQKEDYDTEFGLNTWRLDQLTKTYKLDIKQDTDRERFYSDLPVNVLSIKDNTGIRMVTPLKEESTVFLPQHQVDSFLYNDLDVNLIPGLIYYMVEGKRIWYWGEIDKCWEKVLAKLAIRFEEFEDDDDIQIPEGKEIQLLTMVTQLMLAKQPSDIVDDSTAMQTTK